MGGLNTYHMEGKYSIKELNGISASATTQKQLETILKFYEASTIIIGHSVVSDIQSDYNNKVIKIDVKHGNKVSSGKTKGLFMEHNSFYKTDDFGNKAIILKG